MRIGPQRPINPDAIVTPQGYRVEALITGLTFPSALSFGPGGEIYLAEGGGVCGMTVGISRVLRADPDQTITEIGRLDNPITGLVYRAGELLIGEDAPAPRVLRVTAEGEVQVLVQGLPGGGDYGLSGLSLDASGALLFGLGTRTNSGVVGLDNVARGWVSAHPDWADIPGLEVELAGVNYVTTGPGGGTARSITGGFKPFGRRGEPGEAAAGAAVCGGAVYRLAVDGAEPERLAWGLRNPVGVAIGPDGRIYATEGGMEERGSRPIAAAPDSLWEIRSGSYYGWPDFAAGVPVTDPRFRLPGHPQPRPLLASGPRPAGPPVVTFPARSGVGRFDFSTSEGFGFVGEALVALSGEWTTGAYPDDRSRSAGHRVVRVDPRTGQTVDFLANRDGGPASGRNAGGLERPFDVQFDPSGEVLYVLDLGEIRVNQESGIEPYGGTGVLWRITRARPTLLVPPVGQPEPEMEEHEQPAEVPAARETLDAGTEAPPATGDESRASVEMLGSDEGEVGEPEGDEGGTEPDEVAQAPSRPVVESVFEEEAPPLAREDAEAGVTAEPEPQPEEPVEAPGAASEQAADVEPDAPASEVPAGDPGEGPAAAPGTADEAPSDSDEPGTRPTNPATEG